MSNWSEQEMELAFNEFKGTDEFLTGAEWLSLCMQLNTEWKPEPPPAPTPESEC